jgi:hypothetical protein
MKASKCSLHDIMLAAAADPELGFILSFVQVEYGLTELEGHWDGFSSASDEYQVNFRSKKQVASSFGFALREFFELEINEFEPVS